MQDVALRACSGLHSIPVRTTGPVKVSKALLHPCSNFNDEGLLGGSWVVISGVISRVTSHIRGLITLLITPSRV